MLHPGNLFKAAGSTHSKKRIGRGEGSGHGGTSCRGYNGQKSRSGATIRVGFEGGQMPMNRRLPKFGFTNRSRKEYQEVNIQTLLTLLKDGKIKANTTIDAKLLYDLGVIRKRNVPVKVLGRGDISVALSIQTDKITKQAELKIKNAGGSVTING
jgi:large subunit ribosomal protein L15